jgi:hypothetical protein
MAVSPLATISNATSFIQPALPPRLLTPAQAFTQVLQTSLSGPPTPPASLVAAARSGEFPSALEAALFRNLVRTVESANLAGLTPAVEPLFAGELNLTEPLSPESLQRLLAGASQGERLVLSVSLAALFSTIQLLGAEADQEPTLGRLLDTLA